MKIWLFYRYLIVYIFLRPIRETKTNLKYFPLVSFQNMQQSYFNTYFSWQRFYFKPLFEITYQTGNDRCFPKLAFLKKLICVSIGVPFEDQNMIYYYKSYILLTNKHVPGRDSTGYSQWPPPESKTDNDTCKHFSTSLRDRSCHHLGSCILPTKSIRHYRLIF